MHTESHDRTTTMRESPQESAMRTGHTNTNNTRRVTRPLRTDADTLWTEPPGWSVPKNWVCTIVSGRSDQMCVRAVRCCRCCCCCCELCMYFCDLLCTSSTNDQYVYIHKHIHICGCLSMPQPPPYILWHMPVWPEPLRATTIKLCVIATNCAKRYCFFRSQYIPRYE